ncbi:unnamed protein product, partial [Trichobilharzia regenti]
YTQPIAEGISFTSNCTHNVNNSSSTTPNICVSPSSHDIDSVVNSIGSANIHDADYYADEEKTGRRILHDNTSINPARLDSVIPSSDSITTNTNKSISNSNGSSSKASMINPPSTTTTNPPPSSAVSQQPSTHHMMSKSTTVLGTNSATVNSTTTNTVNTDSNNNNNNNNNNGCTTNTLERVNVNKKYKSKMSDDMIQEKLRMIVSIGDPNRKYQRLEKIGQG